MKHFREAQLKEGDFVFVPGMDLGYVNSVTFRAERAFSNWLRECADKKVTTCTICTKVPPIIFMRSEPVRVIYQLTVVKMVA